MIGKEAGRRENKRTNRDSPDYGINVIGQNSEKKFCIFEETCCLSNSSESPSVNADVKTSSKRKILVETK